MNVDYVFLILHYNAFDMTVRSINCIINHFSDNNIKIIVVDNASPNQSGALLQELFSKNSFVHVILADKNLGFAKGNNLGYEYAVKNYSPKFIICMNNDVLIHQRDFLDGIETIYKAEQFAVLGPDIVALNGHHQNPARLVPYDYEQLLRYQVYLGKCTKHFNFWFYIKRPLLRIFSKIKAVFSKKGNAETLMGVDYALQNPVLHGACYIFSKDFIQQRENAFNSGTFMFFEEDILQYECMQSGLKMTYSPQIQVEHLEDVSTNSVFKGQYQKVKFLYEESYRSVTYFLNKVYKK